MAIKPHTARPKNHMPPDGLALKAEELSIRPFCSPQLTWCDGMLSCRHCQFRIPTDCDCLSYKAALAHEKRYSRGGRRRETTTESHMCFPISVILEKKLAGKNRTHFSNTTHDPILHTKYHPQLPTYFAFYAHAKFSSTVSTVKNYLAYIAR